MVETASTMRPLGMKAPEFELPDTSGKTVTAADFADAEALLIVFMCNHCPFVKHLLDHFVTFAREVQVRGVAVVAINSNDVGSFPADAPDKMAALAAEKDFTFPYLYDETQEVAQAYGAACTPDFFLFGPNRTLAYRGQYDDSRPGNGVPVTGSDLKAAIDAVLDDGSRSP